MEHIIDAEFKELCKEIVEENNSLEEWAEIESDDMFQSKNYFGGFYADEMEFGFTYYDKDDNKYWFKVSLDIIEKILDGEITRVSIEPYE
mgnify:CR=1 FL=1